MENLYVNCVEIWTSSPGGKKQNIQTTAKWAWSICAWLGSHTWQWPGYYMPCKSNQISKEIFSPLSFLSFLSWPLLSAEVLNDGGFLWKGALEIFYVKCVEIWTLSQGRKTQKNGNNYQKCLKHKCMAEFTPGKLRFQTPLFSFQEIFSLFS